MRNSRPYPALQVEDDRALVSRINKGDQAAFRELYHRHAQQVVGTVYRLLGRDDEVDDVMQDTFLEAYRALKNLRDPGSVRSWLRTTAVRFAYRTLRRRKRRRSLTQLVKFESETSGDSRDDELTAALYQALEQIDPKLRIPWILRHLEEHSLGEVAALCDISLATAKRRISKARARLQRRLDHE